MKKVIYLLLISAFVSLSFNGIVASFDVEKNLLSAKQDSFYVSSKPLEEYNNPGFVCGFYNRIDWLLDPWTEEPICPHYLYSPHMLFGWDYSSEGPFSINLQIAAFSSRVFFTNFNSTFVGIFTGTEPGFICGFVDGTCFFTYGFYP